MHETPNKPMKATVGVTVLLVAVFIAGPGWSASSGVPGSGQRVSIVKVFLVAVGDEGRSGKKIGCDDSLVAVERPASAANPNLETAIADLLSLRETHYGQSGLYNALARSNLKTRSVTLVDGTAEIRLTGTIALGGACDAPRVDGQLRETALQFQGVKRVSVFVNDVPLENVLSPKMNTRQNTSSIVADGTYADLPGVRLWYRDSGGSGIVVVPMHAATGSSEAWDHQIPAFKEAGYRICPKPDTRPGSGLRPSIARFSTSFENTDLTREALKLFPTSCGTTL